MHPIFKVLGKPSLYFSQDSVRLIVGLADFIEPLVNAASSVADFMKQDTGKVLVL